MASLLGTTAANNYLKTAAGSFYGYQPQFVSISIPTNKLDFDTSDSIANSDFTKLIRACQTVGSTVIIGTPATVSSDNLIIIGFDGATLNKGAGSVTSGAYGALKDAIGDINSTIIPGDVTITEVSIAGATFA